MLLFFNGSPDAFPHIRQYPPSNKSKPSGQVSAVIVESIPAFALTNHLTNPHEILMELFRVIRVMRVDPTALAAGKAARVISGFLLVCDSFSLHLAGNLFLITLNELRIASSQSLQINSSTPHHQ
jgi:hypothetical protein